MSPSGFLCNQGYVKLPKSDLPIDHWRSCCEWIVQKSILGKLSLCNCSVGPIFWITTLECNTLESNYILYIIEYAVRHSRELRYIYLQSYIFSTTFNNLYIEDMESKHINLNPISIHLFESAYLGLPICLRICTRESNLAQRSPVFSIVAQTWLSIY